MLKGRYRILSKKMEFSPKVAATIFVVCCILHNILQRNGEEESEEFIDDMISERSGSEKTADRDGEKKRNKLSLYLKYL